MLRTFYKLGLTLGPISIDDIKGDLLNDYNGLVNFSIKDDQLISDHLHGKVNFRIRPNNYYLVEISGEIIPHTDESHVKTSLIYYIQTDGSDTCFWQGKPNAGNNTTYISPIGSIVDSKARTWERDHLSFINSFNAEDGDIYLLDVSRPHSIEKPSNSRKRYLIKWDWDKDFDTVLASIRLS